MIVPDRPKLVLLGMMTKMPVAGVVWQTIHYLLGFQRLGYDVYYVEAHARTPSMLMRNPDDDASVAAAAYISDVMSRFGLADRWAYQALHDDSACFGLSERSLLDLFDSAELVINLHGGTQPRPEHWATGRLVYLGTDPVQLELELAEGREETVRYLEPHAAFFTYAENYGRDDCLLPRTDLFDLRPTRQPVLLDMWANDHEHDGEAFTTIANWRQPWREIRFEGEVYHWSKHHEFMKLVDLPLRTSQTFELALSNCEAREREVLERHGWSVRDSLSLSTDPEKYRAYIFESRAEFTVAKDQNIRFKSGWFSDRAATYLAAGRPVVTQDTGFGSVLPEGRGLLAFSEPGEALAAVDAVNADYAGHSRAARDIAREYFAHDVVLKDLLEHAGAPCAS
jgi:hypothetical protein